MSQRIKATYLVELQIECGDVWGGDTTMEQIIKQAETTAIGIVRKILADSVTGDAYLHIRRSTLAGVKLLGVKKITTQAIQEKD